MNATAESVSEILHGWTPHEKGEALVLLLRELVAVRGGAGLIPVTDEAGEFLGQFVPSEAAKAQTEAHQADMPPAVRERMGKPLPAGFDPTACLSEEELERIRSGGKRKSK